MPRTLVGERGHPLSTAQTARRDDSCRIEDQTTFFDEFFHQMKAMVRSIAFTMKLPSDQTEDVFQEVCLAILEYLDRHGKDAVQRWKAWLRRVIRNKVVDALRRLHPEIVSLDGLAVEPMTPEVERADIDREQRRTWVTERLEETVGDESLNSCLLHGRFVAGRTNAELAAAEGLTEKSVERRVSRKIADLRQKATEDGLMTPSKEDGCTPTEKYRKGKKSEGDFSLSSD